MISLVRVSLHYLKDVYSSRSSAAAAASISVSQEIATRLRLNNTDSKTRLSNSLLIRLRKYGRRTMDFILINQLRHSITDAKLFETNYVYGAEHI